MSEKEEIINFLKNNSYNYVEINDESIPKIYNLLINDTHFEPKVSIEYFYYGSYYKIKGDYDMMKKYYMDGAKFNDENRPKILYNLGHHYQNVEKNYDLMKQYYLDAIEQYKYSPAMQCLAHYYYHIEQNCGMAKTYLLMSVEQGDKYAINDLAYCYANEDDHDNATKYYMMLIEAGNDNARTNLINLYKNIGNKISLINLYHKLNMKQEFFAELATYLSTNASSLSNELLDALLTYQEDDIDKLAQLSVKMIYRLLKQQVDIMDLHFRYSINGLGFEEAKNDFFSHIRS